MLNRMPEISVIIPTYHDWNRLILCIEALVKQRIERSSFEVIIVNNDPIDQPPSGFELPPGFQIIEESKPGSYAARNAALKIAQGEVIAFTDADCIPKPDWLVSGLRYLMDGADRVAGRVELFYKNDCLSWTEIYEKAFAFKQHEFAAQGVSATANLITWRKVLDEVGYFNDSLMSCGDFEWNKRATAMGKSMVFGDSCTVLHPARANFPDLKVRCKRITGGVYRNHGIRWTAVLRAPIPPVNKVLGLARDNNLVARERAIAFMVYYNLKFYKLYCILKFWLGIENPNNFKQ
ncbi:Glycosyl transferase family 2 [Modicisalibacter muralis]|uniref:Glycosyl transferase family 2 n=1 Tax=Modicisalibacter muralis TaxID=119000 RepID=A0A1G9EUX8_9GAMM|nr:glycosyltransferase family A protein [Halomonas muralis]SDK79982.1 Glycosyl transferase family 2 [Halomonas muralis]